jgi:hypothetical protein
MALDIWFKDDIRNILLGVELANGHLASRYSDAEVRAYREGFKAALVATAISLGICPPEIERGVTDAPSNTSLFPLSRRDSRTNQSG